MNPLSRHVVLDLLPLYLAGEVSDETRALVDAYLATDAELLAYVRANSSDREPDLSSPVSVDALELRTVSRTRAVLARQRWLFGLAIGFTTIGLSVSVAMVNGRPAHAHLVLLDFPLPLGVCLVMAVVCWAAYSRLRRRTRL
jgi:anti-sigma factor RsiW